MNVLVTGPSALSDRIEKVMEAAREHLLSLNPPVHLRLVSASDEADCVVCPAPGEDSSRGVLLWMQLPDAPPDSEMAWKIVLRVGADISDEQQQFCSAALAMGQLIRARALQRIVAGPFFHDVRGALSVVALTRQLLEAGTEGRPLAEKLGRVDSKVRAALLDLEARTRCDSGDWPPRDEQSGLSAFTFDDLTTWFSDTHAGRGLVLEAKARTQVSRSPSWFLVALGGVLEGISRLTAADLKVASLEAPEGANPSLALRVSAAGVVLSAQQERALLQPERWPIASPEIIPYRLGTAALLVFAARGTLKAVVGSDSLSVELRLP